VLRALAGDLLASAPGDAHRRMVAVVERELLAHALAVTAGNQLRAARLLGVNRNTLHKRAVELGVLPSPLEMSPTG
jgi:two-component system nitrogen regulation response regulator GlnG